jgi:hypothetical protein
VCFTESDQAHLGHLIATRGFEPWGIARRRPWVYDRGGGPVWHVRSEALAKTAQLSDYLWTWTVRLEAGQSDWLHEREWRVPLVGREALALSPEAVEAVIIGDPGWKPDDVEYVTLKHGSAIGFPNAEVGDFSTLGRSTSRSRPAAAALLARQAPVAMGRWRPAARHAAVRTCPDEPTAWYGSPPAIAKHAN